MASVMQGDAYSIPVTIKSGNGTLITPEIAACVEITVGQFAKRWPGQVTFDEKTGEWKFPMTQNQTFRFTPGAAVVQARVVFQDGSIMGGSGAPMRVEQSASRGTLPQPEKTETTTGSTPKATEVTIPTVHDINVSLHSQVILSDPIKAPYIGDNGNWYEYDAATGEFVDTGVKAGGSADLSLGITAAQVGQIAKITAVDETGKPTKWEPVDIPSGGTDISLGLTAATVGQTVKVKAVDTDGKPTAWETVDAAGEEEKWELIADIDFDVDAANDVFVWEYKNLPNYKELAYKKVSLVGSTETASGITISVNNSYPQHSGMAYAKKGAQYSGWGKILTFPFGWVHVCLPNATSPTNYAMGGLSVMYNAIPFDGDSITNVKLSAHAIYKIAGGKLSLYGRR